MKLFAAFFLQFFICLIFFFVKFLQHTELIIILNDLFYYMLPIASACIVLIFGMTSYQSRIILVPICLAYAVLNVILTFSIKEIIIPFVQQESYTSNLSQTISLSEFDMIPKLPQKHGVIMKNTHGTFTFGILARQDQGKYLIKNIFFTSLLDEKKEYALLSPYAKIIDNKLILYKATFFHLDNKENFIAKHTLKNYILPLPFDIDHVYKLWDTINPIDIPLRSVFASPNSISTIKESVYLLLGYYIAGFFTILMAGIIGMLLSNYYKFQTIPLTEIIAICIIIYPLVTIFHDYISLFINALILLFSKIIF